MGNLQCNFVSRLAPAWPSRYNKKTNSTSGHWTCMFGDQSIPFWFNLVKCFREGSQRTGMLNKHKQPLVIKRAFWEIKFIDEISGQLSLVKAVSFLSTGSARKLWLYLTRRRLWWIMLKPRHAKLKRIFRKRIRHRNLLSHANKLEDKVKLKRLEESCF